MNSTNLDSTTLDSTTSYLQHSHSTTLGFSNPWIQQPLDSTTKNSTTLTFNNPWLQQPLNSTNLGFNNLGFNNPWIQQSWVQQSLFSTHLGFKKKKLKMIFFSSSSFFYKMRGRQLLWLKYRKIGRGNTPSPPKKKILENTFLLRISDPQSLGLCSLKGSAKPGGGGWRGTASPMCPSSWLRRSPIVKQRARQLVHTEAYSG